MVEIMNSFQCCRWHVTPCYSRDSFTSYSWSRGLFAIMPEDVGYCPYVFPAMIGGTLGMDVTYKVTNVFVTTNLPERQQGLAAAVANSVLFLGVSFWLGCGEFTCSQVSGLKGSYAAALWLAVTCGAIGTAIMMAFVKIDPAKIEATIDGKEQQSTQEELCSSTPFHSIQQL